MRKRSFTVAGVLVVLCALVSVSFVSGYVASRADVLNGPRATIASALQQIGLFDAAFAAAHSPPPEVEELFHPFWEAWDLLGREFYDEAQIDKEKLFRGALRGMIGAVGDPYTLYMDPQHRQLSDAEMRGSFDGIGIQVDLTDQQLRVIAPIAGSPAERAGIRSGDVITHVDGQALVGTQLGDTIRMIRGPRGSSVTLTIRREGTAPFDISVVRDQIRFDAVTGEVKGDGVGYVKITTFTTGVGGQLRRVLERLQEQKPVGWVLDLRGNPGGTLDGAISVASQFMSDGVVLYEQRRDGDRQEIRRSGNGQVVSGPMAVLVDKGSASASEIVAAALRDNGRATLVGETTFGKGLVQVIHRLSDGSALRLTIARWLTPGQELIQGTGLTPSVPGTGSSEQVLAQAVSLVRAQSFGQAAQAPSATPANAATAVPLRSSGAGISPADDPVAMLDGGERERLGRGALA